MGVKAESLKMNNPDLYLVTWNIQHPYNSNMQIQVQPKLWVTGMLQQHNFRERNLVLYHFIPKV